MTDDYETRVKAVEAAVERKEQEIGLLYEKVAFLEAELKSEKDYSYNLNETLTRVREALRG